MASDQKSDLSLLRNAGLVLPQMPEMRLLHLPAVHGRAEMGTMHSGILALPGLR